MHNTYTLVIQLSYYEWIGVALLIYLAVSFIVGAASYIEKDSDQFFKHLGKWQNIFASATAWPLWLLLGVLTLIASSIGVIVSFIRDRRRSEHNDY